MRLGVSRVETVQPMASATELHIEGSLATFLPCFEDYVDDVIILRHPESKIQIDSSSPRDRFLAGMVAVRKIDEALPAYRSNVAVKLYLFLPDNLLDGSGLNEQLTSSNIIPYADAPTPETLGDYLTWTVAHESWHLLDIQARLNRIYEHDKRSLDEIDQILADPARWEEEFSEVSVAEDLGWQDFDESYLMSDEMSRPYIVRAGRTSYNLNGGVVQVSYADDRYAFERPAIRKGFLPAPLQHLSDLEPMLKTGHYPTLYSLFNTEDERFAEFGAWYFYAKTIGEAAAFRNLHPRLSHYYEARWRAANRDCRSQGNDWLAVVRP